MKPIEYRCALCDEIKNRKDQFEFKANDNYTWAVCGKCLNIVECADFLRREK